ncbi:MAG: carbon-nitrogen hydrolase family protein [Anaerolineae bacterium]|nr:carbon-nitrogen hydrolase family protein [Anaerolineae bacterium]
MAREVHIAALQLPPPEGDTDEALRRSNLDHAVASLDEAGSRGCDIACLPEAFSTYRVPLDASPEPVPGEVTEAVARVAARWGMYVIAPLAGVVEGVKRNAAVVLGRDGAILGQYFKVHLTQPELDAGYVPGDELPVFDLDFGRIGIMTCLDNSFPETARTLAVKGAEIIFFPHVQSGFGEVGWMAQLISRAIDSCVYLVPVTFGVGREEPWMPGTIMGRSGVIGHDGETLVSAGRLPGVASVVVDLDQPRWVRCFGVVGLSNYRFHAMARRRPEVYGALVEPARLPGDGCLDLTSAGPRHMERHGGR